ncbi:MAG: iron-sulfur cluster assembly protein [Gemmatimonadetes bacterium]|nr:iron-sulfur cluster assembly protein [Gemmatimonadota bacterium]
MGQLTEQRVRDRLRGIRWPGFDTNIVTAGFIRGISIDEARVTVQFQPRTVDPGKVSAMEEQIRAALAELPGVQDVHVVRTLPVLDPVLRGSGSTTPLQAELLESGTVPDPDPVLAATSRWDGRRPGRAGKPLGTSYTGEPRVYQWEIDPTNPRAVSGEAQLCLDAWEYRMWWQLHPERLVYASIQAIEDDTVDHGSCARPHPVGRAVAVNLVYDERRRAIVAIYGTAQDFRPFVEAFRRGFGLTDAAQQGPAAEGGKT